MTLQPSNSPLLSASAAHGRADAEKYRVSPFLDRELRAEDSSCPWHLVGLASGALGERAALAWIIADAIMKERSGHLAVYSLWRTAALSGTKLTGDDAESVHPYVKPVFGLPPDGTRAKDHVPGYVGEWLWYLAAIEEEIVGHELALIDPPSWKVTEGGADGFAVHRIANGWGSTLIFKLWEIKKYTGADSVAATINKAASQLNESGVDYLAKISWANKHQTGDIGQLMSEITELWKRADQRAGAGVSVATNTATAPGTAFTQMATHLPRLSGSGQLRGLILAVDDFTAFSEQVKGYVWSAL